MNKTLTALTRALGGGWTCPCGQEVLGDTCTCGRPKSRPRALVSLFHDCGRNCKGCADTLERTKQERQEITTFAELAGFEEIIVTGGDPMVRPIETANWLDDYSMTTQRKRQRLTLYTARSPMLLRDIVWFDRVDGVTFTVHRRPTGDELDSFTSVQNIAFEKGRTSFRLKIDERCVIELKILPAAWASIELFKWMGPEESCIPEDAVLLDWKGELDGEVR